MAEETSSADTSLWSLLKPTTSADTWLFIPIFEIIKYVFEYSKRVLYNPVKEMRNKMKDLKEADRLNFCIFGIVLVPVSIAYCLISIAILSIEMLLFLIVVFCASIVFILIGILPAFIIPVGVTCISIIRLPINIYYHSAIIYNTVLLQRFAKLVSFMLIPIFHLLTPPVVFIVGLVVQIPVFAAYSFIGYPLWPWRMIQQYHVQAWQKFGKDVETLYRNYGHASGIPENWEGTIYGLPVLNCAYYDNDNDKKIDYWNLFINRCVIESIELQHKKWILPEDVESLSPNTILAIPGVTIVAILVDSINKDKKEKSMIFWDEENICKASNRDYTDNIANVFWPRLMKVKEAIMNIKGDYVRQTTWISAKLCDGLCDRTEELKEVLNMELKDDPGHKRGKEIQYMVEDIVIALLRVKVMQSKMNRIYEESIF